ncbi:MAG: aminotransferase class I/II-fold pyridoxal phosphate-dependent enzyme, partial [Candidatus Latescibacterota bacterium]
MHGTDRTFAGPSTEAVHAGEDRLKYARSITTPVAQTATYIFETLEEFEAFKAGRAASFEYGRYGNPTQQAAEAKVAALEGAESGLLLASGMSAITTALLAMLRGGQHLLLLGDCYRQTQRFCQLLGKFGVASTTVKAWDMQALEGAVRPETRLLLTETPTNPHLRVADLEVLVGFARRHGLKLIVDSTFATPVNLRPLSFGVDLVVHSATKYLGGHNDLVAGGLFGSADLVGAVRDFQRVTGSLIDPWTSYLLLRGLKTLALRVERQNQTALCLASFLHGHPRVRQTYYPALPDHPDHAVATRQMRGCGGVVSFELDGTLQDVRRFLHALQIPYLAPSL